MTQSNSHASGAPHKRKEPLLSNVKTAAVIPSKGIGDALLMMIASYLLKKGGIAVTTYHPTLTELTAWFAGQRLERDFSWRDLQECDLIIAENDNSKTIAALKEDFKEGKIKKLAIFYPTYNCSKHGPLSPYDQVFDPTLPMAENMSRATAYLLEKSSVARDNGLIVLPNLIYRLHPTRILIHPTSSQKQKNWPPSRFIQLAKLLRRRRLNPIFCLSPEEKKRPEWKRCPFEAPRFETLSDLASYTYESSFVIGNDSLLGHLASNLNIPTLIISDHPRRMALWRPGWLKGEVLTPPKWIPNFKPLRLRTRHWKTWITPRRVLNAVIANLQ